jgi:hypothetical protein
MNSHFLKLTTNLFVLWVTTAWATVRYVDVNNASPAPPYTNWATAARVIQEAVDAAAATGDEIVVTSGIYAAGGRAVSGTTTNRVGGTSR